MEVAGFAMALLAFTEILVKASTIAVGFAAVKYLRAKS
jgi:hypothetical protein